VFDRFEDDCKRAMNEARKEAQRLRHDFLDAEHMLLGLLLVPGCTAIRMLQALGCDVESIRARVEAHVTAGQELEGPGQLPFTRRSKRILELAMQHAGSLGDDYIGTEHLLLGYALLAERDEKPAEILGVDPERLRSVLDKVQRGEKVSEKTAYRDPTKPPWDDPRMFGPPGQQLRVAAEICELAKVELVREQRFEQASKARDIAHWLRVLADDVGGKASN